jgi:DNA-directed RNA polymerase subunit RPC12/RpoP
MVAVKALSKLIRGKFASRLKKKHTDLYNSVDPYTWSKDWVAHSLHYGKGESFVLKYLARYVFRIAITNHRIISMDKTHVTFRYKDRRVGKWRTCRVEGCEFIRRYLQHVLPKGFHKVRYYGIWHSSSNNHVSRLAGLMAIAGMSTDNQVSHRQMENSPEEQEPTETREIKCPYCGSVRLEHIERLPRPRSRSPSVEMIACFYERGSIAV